jgi:hypothetical protein
MVKITSRRMRQATEKALRSRRDEVGKHFRFLKSSHQAFPNISQFRELPVIKLLQTRMSKKSVSAELKHPMISRWLCDDLEKWREAAKATLAGVLGHRGWTSASKQVLHPVYRITARFRCSKCSIVGAKSNCEGMYPGFQITMFVD